MIKLKGSSKGWYTYDVHENCPIFKTLHPLHPLVHLRPKFLHPLDLGRAISNEFPPPFPLQMITNQLKEFKENIIQGWRLYVIRSFLQVNFRFQYQLINLVWFTFEFFSFSWSLISASSWLYTIVCAVVQNHL